MTAADITAARATICAIVAELGAISGALDTIEEIRRLPTTTEKDRAAIGEAACDARDAAFQVEFLAGNELWGKFDKLTKNPVGPRHQKR